MAGRGGKWIGRFRRPNSVQCLVSKSGLWLDVARIFRLRDRFRNERLKGLLVYELAVRSYPDCLAPTRRASSLAQRSEILSQAEFAAEHQAISFHQPATVELSYKVQPEVS